jgi:hypothetical protein
MDSTDNMEIIVNISSVHFNSFDFNKTELNIGGKGNSDNLLPNFVILKLVESNASVTVND